MFLGVFMYAIGFVGNVLVPKSIDSAPQSPLGVALLINVALLGLFAVQHSVMARPTFKKWWTQIIPKEAERSTYMLFSNLALIALFLFWEPIGGTIWDVQNPVGQAVLYAVFGIGWLIVLGSSFAINHFDLFGLRQVWLCLVGKEYTPLKFRVPGPYRLVRHPLYVGWLTAFWATPTMTVAHLVFAGAITAYILITIYFEERNLIEDLGEDYTEYKRTVPGLIPFSKKKETPIPEALHEAG
jgi:protein-S-isoprenylcysteine O-methyltransferase Ste14